MRSIGGEGGREPRSRAFAGRRGIQQRHSPLPTTAFAWLDRHYPALAWAIVNRVGARGFADNLPDVINQTDSKGRPELGIDTPLWISSALPDSLTGPNALSYQKALSVADGVLNRAIADPTQGARYFYSGDLPNKGFFPNAISSGRLVASPYPGKAFTFYTDTQH